MKEYAAEGSSVYSDDMIVRNYVQKMLPTKKGTVTEALHRMTVDHSFSLSNVVCLAQAKGLTDRARSALYKKTSISRANRRPVMVIVNLQNGSSGDYSRGPSTSLEPEQDPFLLMPDAERTF